MADQDNRNNGDNSDRDAQGRFATGNPGKPRGSRHKATMAIEKMLDGEAEVLTRKAIELALEGDTTALRLCLERLLPPRKGRTVRFELPEDLGNPAALKSASLGILDAVARGDASPEEAAALTPFLESVRRCIETDELERRLTRLERNRRRDR